MKTKSELRKEMEEKVNTMRGLFPAHRIEVREDDYSMWPSFITRSGYSAYGKAIEFKPDKVAPPEGEVVMVYDPRVKVKEVYQSTGRFTREGGLGVFLSVPDDGAALIASYSYWATPDRSLMSDAWKEKFGDE